MAKKAATRRGAKAVAPPKKGAKKKDLSAADVPDNAETKLQTPSTEVRKEMLAKSEEFIGRQEELCTKLRKKEAEARKRHSDAKDKLKDASQKLDAEVSLVAKLMRGEPVPMSLFP